MITELTKHIDSEALSAGEIARTVLEVTEGGPFLLNDWDDVVMVHYEVDPAALQSQVPFELDCREGNAYVSLVSFTMRHLRPRRGGRIGATLFGPIANHEFLNLRTYVIHQGERGIYFLAEWLPNRLSVLAGPIVYGLPYRHGSLRYGTKMLLTVDVTSAEGRWSLEAREPMGRPTTCEAGSLDDFLLERYTAFTDRGGRLGCFRIWHLPWEVQPLVARVRDDSLPASTGRWFRCARLIGGHFSRGVKNVWVGRPRFLRAAKPPQEESVS